jgi:large subunit ribosomal protein L30
MASLHPEAEPKGMIEITQKKSAIGGNPAQRRTMRTLGLRRIGETVTRQDSPSLRGMLRTVEHLIEVRESDR